MGKKYQKIKQISNSVILNFKFSFNFEMCKIYYFKTNTETDIIYLYGSILV